MDPVCQLPVAEQGSGELEASSAVALLGKGYSAGGLMGHSRVRGGKKGP